MALGRIRRRHLWFAAALAAIPLGFVTAVGDAAFADAAQGTVRDADSPDAVAGSYLVMLRDHTLAEAAVRRAAAELTRRHGGTVSRAFASTVHGFSAQMTGTEAGRLAADPAVEYVQQDQRVSLTGTQVAPPSWGLDRIDQRSLPLSNSYTYPSTAATVHAYVIDTGIRITHQDFGGRAQYGYDAVDNNTVADDCNGHGTHVAGTIGGTSYGVAKQVRLVAVRVLDCTGWGTDAQIVAGIDWVTAHAARPAVANLSLGGSVDPAIDDAVAGSIAAGITYVVAAGNSHADACQTSPARVPSAVTVGATDRTDTRASFSNYGSCVDLFAPGASITSTYKTSDSATAVMSGTSMATPHVTGAAALLLAANPNLTPQQVRDALVNNAVPGAVADAGPGSPTALLDVAPPAPVAPRAPVTTPPATTTPNAPALPGTIALRAHANGRYVTADSAGTAPLIADQGTVGQWERFDTIDAGNGYVGLRARANGRYVTAESAGAAPLIANRTGVAAWERFKLVDNADGSVSLLAAANGRYVTAQNAGAAPLIANRTAVSSWEKFDVVDPATLPASPVVSLRAHANDRYVTAQNSAAPLYANRTAAGAGEQFDEVDAGNGYVALRSHANGRYVTADNGGAAPLIANRTVVGGWEKFQVVTNADGSVSLKANANGRFVTAENGGASALIANRLAVGSWEEFSVIG